mmetsp:Transcript_7778/g.11528  ORF Transcript_7778/g.11528 Transcript_7778/m.11528 type:complete len:216 (-) Transcript_7778:782-1429(-)
MLLIAGSLLPPHKDTVVRDLSSASVVTEVTCLHSDSHGALDVHDTLCLTASGPSVSKKSAVLNANLAIGVVFAVQGHCCTSHLLDMFKPVLLKERSNDECIHNSIRSDCTPVAHLLLSFSIRTTAGPVVDKVTPVDVQLEVLSGNGTPRGTTVIHEAALPKLQVGIENTHCASSSRLRGDRTVVEEPAFVKDCSSSVVRPALLSKRGSTPFSNGI